MNNKRRKQRRRVVVFFLLLLGLVALGYVLFHHHPDYVITIDGREYHSINYQAYVNTVATLIQIDNYCNAAGNQTPGCLNRLKWSAEIR